MARGRRSKVTSATGVIATRSNFEAKQLMDLEAREVAYEYEADKISYIPIPKVRTYTPDFTLVKKDKTKMFIETKGHFTTADRMKHLNIHRHDPTLDIRFVFQNANNKIYRGSKTTYAGWCEKQGFKWAQGLIPDEWLKEL